MSAIFFRVQSLIWLQVSLYPIQLCQFHSLLAPCTTEVIVEGKHSKAADVYSYGIMLWELFTGGSDPYPDIERSNLARKVSALQKRPKLPPITPTGYRDLCQRCWSHDPKLRPSFEEILEILKGLISRGPTSRRIKRMVSRELPANEGAGLIPVGTSSRSRRASKQMATLNAILAANVSDEGKWNGSGGSIRKMAQLHPNSNSNSNPYQRSSLDLSHVIVEDASVPGVAGAVSGDSLSPLSTSSSRGNDLSKRHLMTNAGNTQAPSPLLSPFSSAALLPLPLGHSVTSTSTMLLPPRSASYTSLSPATSAGTENTSLRLSQPGMSVESTPSLNSRASSSSIHSGDVTVGPNPLGLPPRLLTSWSRPIIATSTMETIKEADSESIADTSCGSHIMSNASSMLPASSLGRKLSFSLGDRTNSGASTGSSSNGSVKSRPSAGGLAQEQGDERHSEGVSEKQKLKEMRKARARSSPLHVSTGTNAFSSSSSSYDGSQSTLSMAVAAGSASRAMARGRVMKHASLLNLQPLPVLMEEGGEGEGEGSSATNVTRSPTVTFMEQEGLLELYMAKKRQPAWIIGSGNGEGDEEPLEL